MTSTISILGINGSPRKSGGTVVMLNGGFQAASHLASVLDHFGLVSPPYSITFRNRNIRKNKETEWMWHDTALIGKNLVTMCAMLKKEKPDWDY